jgi:hypothetical protein
VEEVGLSAKGNTPAAPGLAGSALTPVRSRPWRAAWPAPATLRKAAVAAGYLGICLAFLASVQFSSPDLVGTDGYYHIRFAEVMRQQGLRPDFIWLPLTILSPEQFSDHHLLFHVLLIPFTYGDLVLGAKWASLTFATAAFAALAWLLKRMRVRWAFLWALSGLIVSQAFIYRMSMTRVQALSLAFMLLALGLLLSRRHRWLLPLGFLYVWLYNAFPLLLLVCTSYVVADGLLNGRIRFAPLGYACLGIALGLLINPYFPDNLVFTARHFLPKLTERTSIRVGNEWFPYDTAQLLDNSGLALLAFASGVVALGLRGRRMELGTATALLCSLALGLMLFQSRRFIEYFPPFALVFAASAWSSMLPGPAQEASAGGMGVTGEPRVGRVQTRRRFGLAIMVVGALALGLWSNLRASQESVRTSRPSQRYQAAATWLAQNTRPGVRVFQTDWDDFPRLFFYNTHNTYTIGLDPTYLQLQDAELYDLWVDLTQGRSDDLSADIRGSFGAEFAITDLAHTRFLRAAADDPEMREVFRDEYAVVFAVEPDSGP